MNKRDITKTITVNLVGNPNVGKSTIFNQLTGLKQHTGNWAGKTVDSQIGTFNHNGCSVIMNDLPGCYSLLSLSGEEAVTRDAICFNQSDITVVVCDATLLHRNLNLLLQVLEITNDTILCINLCDEAKKNGIEIDFDALSRILKIPVVPTAAGKGEGLELLKDTIVRLFDTKGYNRAISVKYDQETEQKIKDISNPELDKIAHKYNFKERFLRLKIIENDAQFISAFNQKTGVDLSAFIKNDNGDISYRIADRLVKKSEEIANSTLHKTGNKNTTLKIDKIMTHKVFGPVIALLMLGVIFWITITAANYPSELLNSVFKSLENKLYGFFTSIGVPAIINDALVFGIYRVVSWIVAVMLPPMAIFFPLFTLLEDLGFLPRIAFNLDSCFKKCGTCGKQSLTMCMGFGCNAVGVTGCKIFTSKKDRMIAILTNAFVPCNGRFPTLITLITLFFAGGFGILSGMFTSFIMCLTLFLSVGMTLIISFVLSRTLFGKEDSAFTLELPPYRKPQILKTIVRSVLDRTIFVLGRAVTAAIPAGLIIWLMANISVGGSSILNIACDFLEPFGKILGLDGVIVMAFILSLPANEILLPVMVMAYSMSGNLTEISDLSVLSQIFTLNGWTAVTALNVIIFTLFHWPCATTLQTIKKETGSIYYTVFAALLPTAIGVILCIITNLIYHLIR